MQARSLVEKFFRQIRGVKNSLGAAFAIANIDEDQAAEIAPRMDPARQRDGLARYALAEARCNDAYVSCPANCNSKLESLKLKFRGLESVASPRLICNDAGRD